MASPKSHNWEMAAGLEARPGESSHSCPALLPPEEGEGMDRFLMEENPSHQPLAKAMALSRPGGCGESEREEIILLASAALSVSRHDEVSTRLLDPHLSPALAGPSVMSPRGK